MPESDSIAAQRMTILESSTRTMPGVTDSYIREQLETRRERLATAIAAHSDSTQRVRFQELLSEVDSALGRMDSGTYGICEACHDSIERERLIEDPLVRLCLDHLTGEQRRALEGDLELAAGVQRSLLPPPNVTFLDWEIDYEYKPAGLVSGDYCDVILPYNPADGVVFLVGDVSGKGVAASLLMSYLRATFRSLSSARLDMNKLLEAANRLFCESTMAGQFATLICGRTGRDGEMQIASAGHCPALLITKSAIKQVGATGLPLGMFSTGHYALSEVNLQPGDSLLVYTDGISEARDLNGSEYGIDNLSKSAHECFSRTPRELVAACSNAVRAFTRGTPQADDQTLMTIRRSPLDPRSM